MEIDSEARTGGATAGHDYAQRMIRLRSAAWKRLIPAQAPYRWHVRRLCAGRTLDVGCGIGRNLEHLGGRAVGVDHNETCVQTARERGLTAYASHTFAGSPHAVPASYDTLLFAHVLEHMAEENAADLVREHLRYLKPGGRVVIITPQERGFATDATHLTFVDHEGQRRIAREAGLDVLRQYSFPLPRPFGRVFPYNEFVAVARYFPAGAAAPRRGMAGSASAPAGTRAADGRAADSRMADDRAAGGRAADSRAAGRTPAG